MCYKLKPACSGCIDGVFLVPFIFTIFHIFSWVIRDQIYGIKVNKIIIVSDMNHHKCRTQLTVNLLMYRKGCFSINPFLWIINPKSRQNTNMNYSWICCHIIKWHSGDELLCSICWMVCGMDIFLEDQRQAYKLLTVGGLLLW